jgi:tetratricopeptide (TPR) repeat protein
MRSWVASALLVLAAANVLAQSPQASAVREKSRIHYRLGWEHMRAEQWPLAAKEFQQAIDIDPQFEYPHYGLGRASLSMKKYVEAVAAFEKARDILLAQVGRQFADSREAQRYREERLREVDEQIRLQQSVRPLSSSQRQDSVLRGLQLARENLQENIRRGGDMTIENTVPAWLTLSLGSAYFRAGRLQDAEREYKATVAVDSNSGEAYNNLAVVYLETGRYSEAEEALTSARKAGFRVHPQLEQEIKNRKKVGGPS